MINPLILVTFFPLVGFLVIALMRSEWKTAIRWTALVTSLVTFGISLWVLALFEPVGDLQMDDQYALVGRSAPAWNLA